MRKRDIKIDKYYYVVHDIKQLYCKDFPVKSLVEKFKMTKDIMIIKPRNIFRTRILAHMKAIYNLNKFRDEQIFKMNRLKDAIQHININGVMYNG